jgi:hypothetical protein
MRRSIRTQALSAAVLAVFAVLAFAPSSGAGSTTPQTGCMKQWLFNGVWRVQVDKFDPLMDGTEQVGWQVTEIWRNGSNVALTPGTDTFLKDETLELANGQRISTADTTDSTLSHQKVAYQEFPPSAQFTQVEEFRAAGTFDSNSKPTAVDIAFDAAQLAQHQDRPQFTTGKSDFRFKLDCTASASTQLVAGGSEEVPAAKGCENQWLSNGVWKMRVIGVGADEGGGTSQIGWAVSEQWVNETGGPLTPDDSFIQDEQLVLESGNTIASSNTGGTELNSQLLVFHNFAAGAPFSYQQLFRPDTFSASDKPVRLLVTFDAASLKNHTDKPQFTADPANFRISFHCDPATAGSMEHAP